MQLPQGHGQSHCLRLTRGEVDPLEGDELAGRKRRSRRRLFWRAKIGLRNFIAGTVAGIPDRAGQVRLPIPCSLDAQGGIFEPGKAQPEPEWKKRRDPLVIEPAIACVDPLAVGSPEVDEPRSPADWCSGALTTRLSQLVEGSSTWIRQRNADVRDRCHPPAERIRILNLRR